MPSLNFTVFIDKVIDGTKPHTIRALREIPVKVGDDLSFFTGMRTKQCRRLRPNTSCTGATEILIFSTGRVVVRKGSRFYPATALDHDQIPALAKRDGFSTVRDFWNYFLPRIPAGTDRFRGQLIEWMP